MAKLPGFQNCSNCFDRSPHAFLQATAKPALSGSVQPTVSKRSGPKPFRLENTLRKLVSQLPIALVPPHTNFSMPIEPRTIPMAFDPTPPDRNFPGFLDFALKLRRSEAGAFARSLPSSGANVPCDCGVTRRKNNRIVDETCSETDFSRVSCLLRTVLTLPLATA